MLFNIITTRQTYRATKIAHLRQLGFTFTLDEKQKETPRVYTDEEFAALQQQCLSMSAPVITVEEREARAHPSGFYRIQDEPLARDIASLEDLLAFADKYGELIIHQSTSKDHTIEIYNGYRE